MMVRQSLIVQGARLPYVKDAFPILRVQDVSETFWAMGYTVSREQLEKPTHEFIVKFLEFWVEEILSFSPSDEEQLIDTILKQILQPHETAVVGAEEESESDRPDITSDVLPAVRLMVQFRAAKLMMTKLAMYDFTLMDLLRPESARVIRILSAIINFVRFRDEQSDRWKDAIQEITYEQEKVANLDTQLTSVANEILRLRELLELNDQLDLPRNDEQSNSPRWTKANQLNDGLRAEVKRLSDLSNVWFEKCKALKVSVSQKYHKITALEQQVIDSEDERKRLQTYSQMDPADIGKIIDGLRSSLRTEEETLRSFEASDKNMMKTMQSIQLIDEELQKLTKLAISVVKGAKTLEHSQDQVSRSKDELNSYKHKLERFYVQKQGLEKKVELSEERVHKLQVGARKQEEEAQTKQAELYAEYEQLALKREKNQQELDSIKLENDEITAQTDVIKDQYHHEYSEAQEELARLNILIRDYMSEIKSLIS